MSSNDKHRNKRKTFISSESNPNSRTLPRIMLDSGADTACVSKQEFLTEVYAWQPWPVLGVTGKTYIKKRGTLTFYSVNDPHVRKIVLRHVPIIPESPHDIIVGQSLLDPPGSVTSRVGTTKRITDCFNDTIVTAERSGALYYIVQPQQISAKSSGTRKKTKRSDRKWRASLVTWHQRLGHPGYQRVKEIATNGLIHGLELSDKERKDCVHCDMGKLHQHPANFFEAKRTYKAGSKLHGAINVFPTQTASGFKYALIFTDETSTFSWVFLLKTRED
jgi:hypothetical protein